LKTIILLRPTWRYRSKQWELISWGRQPVQDALDIVEGALHLDGATVDLKLRDGMAFPVAEALLKRGTPFVFATAYDEAAIPARFRSRLIRCKLPTPYSDDDACWTFPSIPPLS
jgi:hypothetical protein